MPEHDDFFPHDDSPAASEAPKPKNVPGQKETFTDEKLTEKCWDCGQKLSGCLLKHKTVKLPQRYILNTVSYGPGEALVPADADLFAGF
jgi:hypothetical protein